MGKIPVTDAAERLKELPGWTLSEGALERQFAFAGFPEAVAFVVRLAFQAEADDHHPDIRIDYKRVTLDYVTHSEGGLTDKDFAGASSAARLAAAMGAA